MEEALVQAVAANVVVGLRDDGEARGALLAIRALLQSQFPDAVRDLFFEEEDPVPLTVIPDGPGA